MATVSKESLAQFWINTFPVKSNYQYLSFSDSSLGENLLKFTSNRTEDQVIFNIIHDYIQQTKTKKRLSSIRTQSTSPKQKRLPKANLTNIDGNRLKFSINIETFESTDDQEESIFIDERQIEDRTIENLSSILNEIDHNIISKRFNRLIYPWIIDLSFNPSNDVFTILVELMNKYSEEFFIECFIPWLKYQLNDNVNLFFTNLFTQLTNISNRCQLCVYLCENLTCPLNNHQISIISHWFDSKEFYFSNDLLNILPEKLSLTAKIHSDDLIFAKCFHKILLKCTENDSLITNEQRLILKQAISINTTMLSDILMDLLD